MCVWCAKLLFYIFHINRDNMSGHVRPRVKAKIQYSDTYLFISHKGTALIHFEVITAVVKH